MKVLEIQGQVEGGGSERHTFMLSRALRDRGHDVVLCVPDAPHEMVDEMVADGFEVERFPLVPSWRRIVDISGGLRIRNIIKRHGIEIVHSHIFNADAIGFFGARITGRPVVTTLHGATLNPDLDRTPLIRTFMWGISQIFRRMDHRIAISPFVQRYVSKDASLDPDSIEVIYNATDTTQHEGAFDREQVRRELGIPPEGEIVLCLGVLNHQKRTRLFVEMALGLAPERPSCHFVLAGLGGMMAELKDRVSAAGLSERVHFLGYRSDVPSLLSVTDILAFPAEDEGFGRSMTEAMSSAVPVVAFDSGACSDVVENGVTGFIVADGDVAAMTARCKELLEDPMLRERLGRAGFARARALFGVARFADRTEAALLRVLREHRGCSGH